MKDVKAISLDAAGTLMEVAEPVAEVYARIAAGHGADLDPDAIGKGFHAHFPGMPPMAFGRADEDALPRLERAWWRTLVRRVVSGAGSIDAFDEFFDELYRHYARADAWRVFDEVPALLEDLAAAGYRVAVLSNFDSRLVAVLDGLGLNERVDGVLYSTKLGAAKPDPAAFRAVVEFLGVPVEQCLHVGDSRSADLEGSQNAGLHALFLDRRPRSKHNPKLPNINQLGEIRGYLGMGG